MEALRVIDEYIAKYGKRLYGLCVSLCNDSFEAENLYQETWLKAVKNISKYDTSREFEPWVTRICVNIYRNKLRRISKSPIITFKNSEEKEKILETVSAPPENQYTELYDAINKLPEKLRVTVILFYFRDMDTESAALSLNIPSGTVKSRLNKAKKLLRKELTDSEADL